MGEVKFGERAEGILELARALDESLENYELVEALGITEELIERLEEMLIHLKIQAEGLRDLLKEMEVVNHA